MELLRHYDVGKVNLDNVLNALYEYELLWGGKEQRLERYRRILEENLENVSAVFVTK